MLNDDFPFNINTHLIIPFCIVVGLCFIIMVSHIVCFYLHFVYQSVYILMIVGFYGCTVRERKKENNALSPTDKLAEKA